MKRYALSAGCLLSMVLLLSSCGADIAEAWDPALAYGSGILAYFICALVMPEGDTEV